VLLDMGLTQASQLGTAKNVYNLIELFGSLISFVAPFLIGLLIIYLIIRINRKYKERDIQKQIKKHQQEMVQKQMDDARQQNIALSKATKQQPLNIKTQQSVNFNRQMQQKNKNGFEGLELRFDKNGKAIKLKGTVKNGKSYLFIK
jgi:mannitol-specific phosphotransferase system IIBC component